MDKIRMQQAHAWIREELDRCIKFWLDNGMDAVHGGVTSFLTEVAYAAVIVLI